MKDGENADLLWLKNYPKEIDWHAEIEPKPLYQLLLDSAEKYPKNICLEFKGQNFSYAQIAKMAKCFAQSLQEMGVKKGSHVGLFMPNCPQYVVAYYGILMAGGVVVNYNPLYCEAELKHQIDDSNSQIMVTLNLKRLCQKLEPLLAQTALKKIIIADLADCLPVVKGLLYHALKRQEINKIPKDDAYVSFKQMLKARQLEKLASIDARKDIAVLQYTGGTTGVPKGVMLSHANLHANVEMCNRWFFAAKQGEETIMGVLPFFHVFAMTTIMNYGIACGFRIIVHPRFELKAVLHDITRKKPSIMAGVPTMFAAIVNHENISKYDLSSLKTCISGGAGLPLQIKSQFEQTTGCVLVEGYGLSEASPVVACNPLVGVNKAGSIGLPFPKTIIQIRHKSDGEKVLGINEIGEICIAGEQVMLGYWNNQAETQNVLRAGVLYSGDLGYIDDDGYIFVVDRKKEMIISGGYNIYPRQIEEALYTHNAVLECAVIGVEHPIKGEAPKAFIVLRAGEEATPEQLRAYLKGKVAAYSVPYEYEFVSELPKSMIGKILKKQLG